MDYKHPHTHADTDTDTDTDTSSGTHDHPPPTLHHIDTQIHITEQDAYYHVLRAFQAQSHALTWEKEALITQLRKELRLSDEEHRHLLARVNNDAAVSRIREWRKARRPQSDAGPTSSHPIHHSIPSPTPRKNQKTGHSPSAVHPPPSVFERGPSPKKSKRMPHPPAAHPGKPLNANRGSSTGARKPAEAANFSGLIGKKVWTRWSDDNNFYEAEITDFKEGNHALVYDKDTPTETWEWVDFKEIRPQDIRWEGDDPGVSQRGSSTGQSRGMKKPNVCGGVNGGRRGRGTPKGMPKKDLPRPQNGTGRKGSADIELLHTDTLIKEVEKVFSRSHPDPTDIEKAKTILKEHEQALIEAISTLQDASDGESDEEKHPFSQEQSAGQELRWRKQQYDGMNGDKGRHVRK